MAHEIKWPYLSEADVSFCGSRINEYESRKRGDEKKSVTDYSWRAFHEEGLWDKQNERKNCYRDALLFALYCISLI